MIKQSLITAICILCISSCFSASSLETYVVGCNKIYYESFDKSQSKISELLRIVDSGECVPQLGEKIDTICNEALEYFSSNAPDCENDEQKTDIFDMKVESLEQEVMTPLQIVRLKQLTLIRERAFKKFEQALDSGASTAETGATALRSAEESFRKESVALNTAMGGAPPPSLRNTWAGTASINFPSMRDSDAAELRQQMVDILSKSRRITESSTRSQQSTQVAEQFLAMQQQQILMMQQGSVQAPGEWSANFAFKVPQSPFNLGATVNPGKPTVFTMGCAPADSPSVLGQNGFVQGLTPANIGLNVNLSI